MPTCNNSETIFFAGNSFANATQLYTDAALTTVANDGLYSFGGVVREMSGGVLFSTQPCPSCFISCGSKEVQGSGDAAGRYNVNFNLGVDTGAVVIRFESNVNPAGLTWTYDGLSASEYSSPTWGYAQGILGQFSLPADGGSYTCGNIPGTLSNFYGSNSATIPGINYVYDFASNLFVPSNPLSSISLGPYLSNEVTLVSGIPGGFIMVVPKPSASPGTLSIDVDALCRNNIWNVQVNCPNDLNSFDGGAIGDPCGTITTPFYTASVTGAGGVSTSIGVYDWAFADINGVTQQPAGQYPVTFGGVPATYLVTVDSNGLVSEVLPCP
jgi:hypothetical protein